VVATNGGSDLIYLPSNDKKLAERTVKALLETDYVSGIFVEDDLGKFPGALPLSLLNLRGNAVTPHPAIVVSRTPERPTTAPDDSKPNQNRDSSEPSPTGPARRSPQQQTGPNASQEAIRRLEQRRSFI
jgi:hypothetical protein